MLTVYEFKKKYGHEEDGFWFPRVTAICEVVAKPGMEKWLADSGSYELMLQKRKKILDWGSAIDKAVKDIFKGEKFKTNHLIAPSLEAFLNWFGKHKIVFFAADKKVVSKKHRYAGTSDIVAEIDGKFGILDIKSSSNFWDEHFMQTAAYCQAFNENESEKVKTHWILRVDQYQECKKCFAQKRDKGGESEIKRGKKDCNHKWSDFKGVCQLKESSEHEVYLRMFLHAKKLWELANRRYLSQIENYPKNILKS